jgi:hypothetical protein
MEEIMSKEIQMMTVKCFDLSMSASITMSSLRKRLGFSSDMDLATIMLTGKVHIQADVNDITTTIIEKIICLFLLLQEGHLECVLEDDHFRYYWGKF